MRKNIPLMRTTRQLAWVFIRTRSPRGSMNACFLGHGGLSNIVYDESGTVYCYDREWFHFRLNCPPEPACNGVAGHWARTQRATGSGAAGDESTFQRS